VVHVGNSPMDSAVEMIGIGEGLMREEVAFQIAPGSLIIPQMDTTRWRAVTIYLHSRWYKILLPSGFTGGAVERVLPVGDDRWIERVPL
jgi:hypothetical protein